MTAHAVVNSNAGSSRLGRARTTITLPFDAAPARGARKVFETAADASD